MRTIVLGAGVVGVTTAYYLAQDGHEVVVVDQRSEVGQDATGGNAGLIAPSHSFAWASPQAPKMLLRSLREGIDYSTPTGRMLAGIFAALAGYERELMHERAAAAREAARLRGRHTGRPPKLTQAQARQVRALRESGESISELVGSYGVSRATIYRALRNDDIPVGPSEPTVVTKPGALVGTGR